jgi:hypothetical protein
VVVAAAGKDHVQLSPQGQVQSHGTLADCVVGPDPRNDYSGLCEIPGGVEVDVAYGTAPIDDAPMATEVIDATLAVQ